MTPERLEELRQMAAAVDGPKSAWMDELIEEVDRLKDQGRTACNLFDDLKKSQQEVQSLELQKYELAAEFLETEAKKIPLGASDLEKGFSSTYNALMFCARALREESSEGKA